MRFETVGFFLLAILFTVKVLQRFYKILKISKCLTKSEAFGFLFVILRERTERIRSLIHNSFA